ncbi:MAG: hypothetical protein PVH88_23795 [Ignavibacteria bacterium]|jgi:hypothetical protein
MSKSCYHKIDEKNWSYIKNNSCEQLGKCEHCGENVTRIHHANWAEFTREEEKIVDPSELYRDGLISFSQLMMYKGTYTEKISVKYKRCTRCHIKVKLED